MRALMRACASSSCSRGRLPRFGASRGVIRIERRASPGGPTPTARDGGRSSTIDEYVGGLLGGRSSASS
jgi:hypothetical protein